ncbi:winged helix-turn-helix domain-containing protein [Desulfotomaculum copahuensis]|uniref:Molybdenum-binding protein n=1 Tax=Desulfotomaculum copahuensis TaxID=1838280 RepID=A0A1B7LJ24_9FIRM|nr:LysR family transcriptional regulator [Desulfotomaculum copahuensis]OAT86471.1 molybdenum-binding protein [Desulfotomaculum copahuensis]
MRLAFKIWLEQNGKAFGDGPCDLLQRIERTGSLRKAAAEIGMSYNQAWRLLRTLEGRLGFPLLVRQVGGAVGGGSTVTPQARRLMHSYRAFREEVADALNRLFGAHFSGEE